MWEDERDQEQELHPELGLEPWLRLTLSQFSRIVPLLQSRLPAPFRNENGLVLDDKVKGRATQTASLPCQSEGGLPGLGPENLNERRAWPTEGAGPD